jgi:hypothetical protein
MNNLLNYAIANLGSLTLSDEGTFASVPVNSSTASNVVNKAHNRAIAPTSYTFVSTFDQYQKIFSGQCDRVHTYIHGQLDNLDQSDDDQNEEVVDSIARVLDLVGEPASCTAMLEAGLLKDNPSVFEPLLLAIGTSRHRDTEFLRAEMLRRYTQDSDYRVRRAAVRALGRMKSSTAKRALEDISKRTEMGEVALLAAALVR